MRMRKKQYLTERLDAVKSLILDTDLEERDFEKAIQAIYDIFVVVRL